MVISKLPRGGAGGEPQPTIITLTLEGAKEDTINIKKANGELVQSVVFPAESTTETVLLPIVDGEEYTFESTVAKAIDSSGNNYSKNVTLTQSTSVVKVMPDSAIWYANDDVNGGLSKYWFANDFTVGTNGLDITLKNNYSENNIGYISNRKYDVTNYSKCVVEYYLENTGIGTTQLRLTSSFRSGKVSDAPFEYREYKQNTSTSLQTSIIDLSTVTGEYYVSVHYYGHANTVYIRKVYFE